MKRYEGLFILNTAGKEEGIKEMIDKVSAELTAVGATILNTQKMERRAFARQRDKRHAGGFYVNFIFNATPAIVANLRSRFAMNEDVYRALFTLAPESSPKPA